MSWIHILDGVDTGTILVFLILALAAFKKALDVAQVIADHTKTKTDNEVIAKLKAFAQTAVTAVESLPVPGNEQKSKAITDIIDAAKKANIDISQDEASKYIEEQYQLIYGVKKPAAKLSDTPEQKQALADVKAAAEKVDPLDYPIHLDDGDNIEISGKTYKLSASEDTKQISLTPEGK